MVDDWRSFPDVDDGLTKKKRAILYCLQQTQKELGRPAVPTAMQYGRGIELVEMDEDEFRVILNRAMGR